MTERDVIMIVVKHPTEDKYLYIHYKNFGWNVLVQGGIEDNENSFISAVRELEEETGFYDIASIEKLPLEMDNVFYAAHKKVNRLAKIKTFFIKLNSMAQKSHEDEFDVMFDTYENLYDIFGPSFRHHYFLLGIAVGKESMDNLDVNDENHLGNVEMVNHKISYR